jgi:hypothetical protein
MSFSSGLGGNGQKRARFPPAQELKGPPIEAALKTATSVCRATKSDLAKGAEWF